jgi:hypothetical protein
MIPALWFTGGAAFASGMIWFGWWLLFAPIEPAARAARARPERLR